jgi:hypothetical protein
MAQCLARPRGVASPHAHWAMRHLAQGATGWPRDASGVLPCLDQARFVEPQDPIRAALSI